MRTALVAGATGLVGSHCVELLLARPDVERVHILVRRAPERAPDPRLVVHVVDFDRLAVPDLRIDDAYLCLGTTMKLAGSRDAFRRIDHDYTVAADSSRRQREPRAPAWSARSVPRSGP